MISARVDRLAAEDRARLRRVAVLGAGFHGEYLGAVDADDVPVEQTLSRLTEFLASDATGWVTFRHALVRDVAYAGLPYRTRQRLHGQVADSILANADDDADTDAALLSLHFFHAQRYDETWHYAVCRGGCRTRRLRERRSREVVRPGVGRGAQSRRCSR